MLICLMCYNSGADVRVLSVDTSQWIEASLNDLEIIVSETE